MPFFGWSLSYPPWRHMKMNHRCNAVQFVATFTNKDVAASLTNSWSKISVVFKKTKHNLSTIWGQTKIVFKSNFYIESESKCLEFGLFLFTLPSIFVSWLWVWPLSGLVLRDSGASTNVIHDKLFQGKSVWLKEFNTPVLGVVKTASQCYPSI